MRRHVDGGDRAHPKAPGRIAMFRIAPMEVNETLEALAAAATREEQTAVRRYTRPQDRAIRLATRILARTCISEWLGIAAERVAIVSDPQGRPIVDGASEDVVVSLSHTREHAVIAIQSKGRIGVDVEMIRGAEFFDQMAASIFCAEELAAYHCLPPNRRGWWATTCWTRKEAVLKALGTGLAVDPCDLSVDEQIGPQLSGAAVGAYLVTELQLVTWHFDDCVVSFCSDSVSPDSVDLISSEDLLNIAPGRT